MCVAPQKRPHPQNGKKTWPVVRGMRRNLEGRVCVVVCIGFKKWVLHSLVVLPFLASSEQLAFCVRHSVGERGEQGLASGLLVVVVW